MSDSKIDSKIINEFNKLKMNITSLVSHNEKPQFNILVSTFKILIKDIIKEEVLDINKYLKTIPKLDNINNLNNCSCQRRNQCRVCKEKQKIQETKTTLKEKILKLKNIFTKMSDNFQKLIINNNIEIDNYESLRKIKTKIINIDQDTEINFSSVKDCLDFTSIKLNNLETKIERYKDYYDGKISGFKEFMYYWVLGWVDLPFRGWYSKTRDAYDNFLNCSILPLKTYIENFKRETQSVNKSFEKINSSILKMEEGLNNDEYYNTREIIVYIENIESRLVTICSTLKICLKN